jgi:hypothetical protein
MCGVTGAIIGAGVIGAGASIIGADKQAGAARDAAGLSMDQFNINNRQQQPFIQTGYAANSRLSHLLGLGGPAQISATPGAVPGATPGYGGSTASSGGFTPYTGGTMFYDPYGRGDMAGTGANGNPRGYTVPEFGGMGAEWRGAGPQGPLVTTGPGGAPTTGNDAEFGSLLRPFDAATFNQYQDPGYQFRLQQGTQAVRNAAAAGSGALSGAALKDLLMFNQDAASQEYGNAFNRYQTQQGNIFSRLSGIAQLGQSAAAGVGQQGTALAGQAGQALSNAGTAAGAGIVGAGNAAGNAASNYWLSQVIKGG